MQIALSGDQRLFRDTARALIESRGPISRVRELIEDPVGFDRDLWVQGAELGWYAMLVPEEYGGGSVSGGGLLDAAIIAEELGRTLTPGPFHPTNVVAFAIAQFGTPAQREQFLPPIVAGDLIASWAFAEPDKGWSVADVALSATPAGDGFVLDGLKTCVQDAHLADQLLVTALAPQGLTQFLLARDTAGVTVDVLEGVDVTRRLCQVRFEGVAIGQEALLGVAGDAATAIESQLQVAYVLQCADTNGATDQGFAMTVQYAKDRVAFGRPIGSYQALKHRMATHRMWLEGSFASAAYAAAAVQDGKEDAAIAARIAAAQVGKWNTAILHDCIQLHGGIGMTWDYDLHLYLRRAISNEVLYGAPNEQYRALVDLAEGRS